MTRILVVLVAILYLSASTAFAQSVSFKAAPQSQSSARVDLSAKAAGLDRIAASTVAAPRSEARATVPASAKKGFWKSPWPYVIIAGAAVIGIIAATKGDGGY